MRFRIPAACALVLAGAFSISCGGIVDPSQNQVQTFSGSVPPGGSSRQTFSAASTGEISIKIVTLTPAAVPAIGVQWVGAGDGSCNGSLFGTQIGGPNTTVISAQIVSGNYCAIMYDYIGQAVTANYSITISHP
jgi:hypothetical protein